MYWGQQIGETTIDPRYDRQVRAFGLVGQDIIRRLKIGIVGLGGTGSYVLQSLAHLGAESLLLLDPDPVEETNLNRLVGATQLDVGKPKVDLARDLARKINPGISIEARQESVLLDSVAKRLIDTDFVFGCTDSHGSRAVLNQLAYQYLVPVIDMGVVIATHNQTVTHIAGRTQLLSSGLACMVCGNLLDPEEVRRDLLTDFERKADPYIEGDVEPAPAVISLNGTIASLAVTMFLNVAVGVPGAARHLNYNALTGHCRPAYCEPHPRCVVCSTRGAFARADEWPLPTRQV
jgi:molybdopterin/thiamine biosynthesis adenylyltransferase